ncbi:hypothetical protein G6F56_009062 [Rhizopus delemar]|nr:hypothetical protein G6F56_009062 [Rhizopus delemar]
MLTLNVDWFKPFDGIYSSGGMYLTINNLRRDIRNDPSNMVLLGVIPGGCEPKSEEMNRYLKPLVDELQELFGGVMMKTWESPDEAVLVRAALLLVAADTPATRKVCGFTSHNSKNACMKCKKKFAYDKESKSICYAGFDTEYPSQTMAENKENALAWKACINESEREKLEKENGTRWSELHRLSYFDCIRCSLVDPMHNLYMGTENRMAHLWIERKLIKPTALRTMQQLASGVIAPPGYDDLQRNIGSGFSFMKSDQWRSWCLVYSPFVLKPILPKKTL